jgi:hypothetical protein
MVRGCLIIAGATVMLLTGCSSKLETGYEPRTIGSNESERRGYYAPPFSKEAREARDRAQLDAADARRPRPGYGWGDEGGEGMQG